MKTASLLCLLLSMHAIRLFAQPSNDDCSGLTYLGEAPVCPLTDTFHNVGATASIVFSDPSDNIPSCFTGGTTDRDVWFSFTTPADGSAPDLTLRLQAVDGQHGGILQPQMAVYRGDCLLDELQELGCVSAQAGGTELELDLLGLTPGLPYFIRVSDWSASATPNWGDFLLCVETFVPVYVIGEDAGSTACAGTLYDSGGDDGDYGNNQYHTFTICPDEFHQCILLDIHTFDLEFSFDVLQVYAGETASGLQLGSFTGSGGGVTLQSHASCVTVLFDSDGSVTGSGFELSWTCSPDTCDIPPPVSCENAVPVGPLPFTAGGLSTCNAGNNYQAGPCNADAWMATEDYVFAYTSNGGECIAVSVTGSAEGTGLGIFDDCPDVAVACLAQAGGGAGTADPAVNAVFLEFPGTYYIVVDNAGACTDFQLAVEKVACPVVFPSAAYCEDALSLNGCGELPAVVSVAPGQGDPTFLVDGINDGCWGGFPTNFTWFSFQAQADGEFGFIMQASDPNEASDIDFQVWGPVMDPAELCSFAQLHQPARSSYAAGADPTGMVPIHPTTGVPVTDTCETATGDDFVLPLPVIAGAYYVVLINDWGNQIVSGAISIDFGGTSPGVMDALPVDFSISPDTVVCPGTSVQLAAAGGEVYQWLPESGLSCAYCPAPVAVVDSSQVYQAVIHTVCRTDTLETLVGILEASAGPDATVCTGETFSIQGGPDFPDIVYQWTAPAGFLSCTDCPQPTVTALQAGSWTIQVQASLGGCSYTDLMFLEVTPGQAPVFEVSGDWSVCLGDTVQIGSDDSAADWSVSWYEQGSTQVFSQQSNPSVSPLTSQTYYVWVQSPECQAGTVDSVTVNVHAVPQIALLPDTVLCQGDGLPLSLLPPEPGVSYSWSPSTYLDLPGQLNTLATPMDPVQYVLTADHNGCSRQDSVFLGVIPVGLVVNGPDTLPICAGTAVGIQVVPTPPGALVSWSPDNGSLDQLTGTEVTAMPLTGTTYKATVSNNGCIRSAMVHVGVDSLPYDLSIAPADTQICQGATVLLTSSTYEPADFGALAFEWRPLEGQLTPDSFLNLLVQPLQSTTYSRVARNGYCVDTTLVTVTVVDAGALAITPVDPMLCQGDSVAFQVTAAGAESFTWNPPTALSCSDCPQPVAAPPSSTTYTVEATVSGCPVSSSVSVTVLGTPTFTAPPPVVCAGESVILNPFPNADWTYQWSASGTPGFSSADPAPTLTPHVSDTITVSISHGNCPSVTFTFPLFVSGNPVLDLPSDTTVCNDQPFPLEAVTNIPGSFWWEDTIAGNPFLPDQLLPGDNLFQLTYHNLCGDTLYGSVLVRVVEPVRILDITHSEDTTLVYAGTLLTLSAETQPDGVAYQWSTGSNTDTTVVRPTEPGTATYRLTVTDSFGCIDSAAISFQIRPSVFGVPNVFTPNGDGTNDTFALIITGEQIFVERMDIWNRWGERVYSAEAATAGWDGQHRGKPAPADVYSYRIEVGLPDGRKQILTGDVTLLR